MSPDAQPVRLVNQQVDSLPTLQYPFNILRHDPFHIVDILLHVRNRILFALLRGSISHHQALELGIEIRRAIRRQAREIGVLGIVAGEKLLLDFDQVAERNPAAEGLRGDDKVC